jgi:hypothetical protein
VDTLLLSTSSNRIASYTDNDQNQNTKTHTGEHACSVLANFHSCQSNNDATSVYLFTPSLLRYGRRVLIISVVYEMRNKQVPRVRKILLNLHHSENNR